MNIYDALDIEKKVSQLVSPVKPDPGFVNQLKDRLVLHAREINTKVFNLDWIYVISGMLLGLVLFLLGRRLRGRRYLSEGI